MFYLLRVLHGAITIFFLACLGTLYYSAITGQVTIWSWLAAAAIAVEGLVVLLNGGDCPLGGLHHQFGDDKAFFELLLPKRAAKLAIPVLGGVAALGFAWMVIAALRG
jgi:hypothetical protein